MDNDRDVDWGTRLHFQSRVTTRRQALDHGIPEGIIDRRLRSGTWMRLYRGAYATFAGEPPREAKLWAALLRAGPGAVLSYDTAAEIQELADKPSSRIHITVPIERNPARAGEIPGVIIHRSRRVVPDPQPDSQLPRTRIDDTVLDLVATAKNFDDAYGWVCRAAGRRLTTAGSLREALAGRKKIRWRAWLADALDDAAEGVNSALERRYVNGVERAHGLPHLAADDTAMLRYGWLDVTTYRCDRARQVAALLRCRGWDADTLRTCNPGCPVRQEVRASG